LQDLAHEVGADGGVVQKFARRCGRARCRRRALHVAFEPGVVGAKNSPINVASAASLPSTPAASRSPSARALPATRSTKASSTEAQIFEPSGIKSSDLNR